MSWQFWPIIADALKLEECSKPLRIFGQIEQLLSKHSFNFCPQHSFGNHFVGIKCSHFSRGGPIWKALNFSYTLLLLSFELSYYLAFKWLVTFGALSFIQLLCTLIAVDFLSDLCQTYCNFLQCLLSLVCCLTRRHVQKKCRKSNKELLISSKQHF